MTKNMVHPMKNGSMNHAPYTPDGKLTEAGKTMLRSMLQPNPEPLAPAERRHAFIMVGTEVLFLVHMTMFHMEEHCYQIVLRARLPDSETAKFRNFRRENPEQAYFLANLTEFPMDVPELASGKITSFQAEVFRGIPPKTEYTEWPFPPKSSVFPKVCVTVERVVYYRHFDFGFDYPKHLTYVLFGAGDEAHMQSYQTKEPDYDHILSLAAAPPWLPKIKLESAVTVSFPKLRSRPMRLKNPLAGKMYRVEYQGFSKYLGYAFARRHPVQIGTTWWFHTSPLNLVPPQLRRGHRRK
jgi:hypothetical protein